MKRFIILPSVMISLFVAILMLFSIEGFYTATTLRNDLFYYMLYVPAISVVFIFCFVYMASSIKRNKQILNDWYKILSLINIIFTFVMLLFVSDVYITVSFTGKLLIVLYPLVMLVVSSIFVIKNRNKNSA